ncbi:unnamed protein product [Cylindrotheca closterium]|uniref:Uncharacterized protein n=1 Tax=Cylindrotheca closterium TaxID=2856 RepID=A0AAD2PWH4_9STRA|nr:unnamed protein product [Cylindrotheca closterium]
MVRGRSETPTGEGGGRGASAGPGPRGRSQDRSGGGANNNAGLMKGKRRPPPPDGNSNLGGGSSHHSSAGQGAGGQQQQQQQFKTKKHKMPKQVRKAVPKKVRKATGKGYKRAKKMGARPVKKFQNTTLGQRIAPPEKCGTAKICSYIFAVLLLIASSIGLVIATGNAGALENFAKGVSPDFDITNLQDPFAGGQIVGVWSVPSKTGLEMEILNALDDSWQAVFTLAVTDWEFGSPDALSLTTTRVDHDPECTPVDGKIKVCNGDYGEQPWRGLATCILDRDRNYANCNAKMNDYYLGNGDLDLKQYTMCHEIGHGFGLPHTDEDFNNADLGNCLDYTENFSVNKSPDASNYDKLVEFYGTVGGGGGGGGRNRRGRGLEEEEEEEEEKSNSSQQGRYLRKHASHKIQTTSTSTLEVHHSKSNDTTAAAATSASTTTASTFSFEMSQELRLAKQTAQPPIILAPTPPHIWEKRKFLLEQFESIVKNHQGVGGTASIFGNSDSGSTSALLAKYGWKVTEKTLFEVEHMIDLGDGYSLEVQISASDWGV